MCVRACVCVGVCACARVYSMAGEKSSTSQKPGQIFINDHPFIFTVSSFAKCNGCPYYCTVQQKQSEEIMDLDICKKRASNVHGMRAMIIRFHERYVTAGDMNHGKRWYRDARAIASNIASDNGFTVAQVCGVISALSPSVSWETNLTDAETICKAFADGIPFGTVTVSTYGQNKDKAHRILSGLGDAESVSEQFKFPSKTGSFFFNLLYPNAPTFVTVDRHALGIALGSRDSNVHQSLSITDKRYRTIADAYVSASRYLGYESPCQLQASTWVAYRRNFAN